MRPTKLLLVAIAAALGASASSCYDPVHSDAVDALGPEDPGVRPGPLHRPGQPCIVCHGERGPAGPEFSIAGTVYTKIGELTPLEGAKVTINDSTGEGRSIYTNSAGNFYILAQTWRPSPPMNVQIDYGEEQQAMQTLIGGNGSCALCHYGTKGEASHMPAVYLRKQ